MIFKLAASYLLAVVSWVLLLAWCAVLLSRGPRAEKPDDDSLVLAPVGSGPLGEDSIKLPLPKDGDDSGGDA